MANSLDINVADKAVLSEEEAVFKRVQFAVRDEAIKKEPNMRGLLDRMKDIAVSANQASENDLPSILEDLHLHQSLLKFDFVKKLPDMRSPYFAHLILEEDGVRKDILIGHQTFITAEEDAGVCIIDWRHAPLAKIFFNYREGETYEITLPKKKARGRVVARRVVTIEMGKLVGVQWPDGNYLRSDTGAWLSRAAENLQLTGGEGSAFRNIGFGIGATNQPSPFVSALLDKEQYRLLQESSDAPLLVLGGAGSGKTTVALHRLAQIHAEDPKAFPKLQLLVIVPEEGLVRLSKKLLQSLRMESCKVFTYDNWVRDRALFLFKHLPKQVCSATPSRISRFKRHVAMIEALPLLAAFRCKIIASYLKKHLKFYANAAEDFSAMAGANILEKLNRTEHIALEKAGETPSKLQGGYIKTVTKVFAEMRADLGDLSVERRELFTNRTMLAEIVARTGGDFDDSIVKEILHHSRKQFSDSDAKTYAGYSEDALIGADLKSVVEEKEDELAQTIDTEDYAILLELLHYYTGGLATTSHPAHAYAHMVIDEAQEFAPIELRTLGHALKVGAHPTIAGDALQKTDRQSHFSTWEDTLKFLGVKQVASSYLQTSYRSTRQIMEFAYSILGELATNTTLKTIKEGPPVRVDYFSNIGLAVTILLEELEALTRAEPKASIAIICADEDSCILTYEALADLPKIRHVQNGEFEFKPGIDVTEVSQVKGLEFDYVIIPDANATLYPVTPEARRALHVAASRAIHQLWVISVGTRSKLCPH